MKNWIWNKKWNKFPQIKNSPGYDEDTSEILKAYVSLFSLPLSYIHNHLLYTGTSPEHLNISVMKSLQKNKISVTNWRHAALLALSAIMVTCRMLSHHMHASSIPVWLQPGDFTIQLLTMSKQAINTIFTGQLSNFRVLKKVHSFL